MKKTSFILLITTIWLAGCATGPGDMTDVVTQYDSQGHVQKVTTKVPVSDYLDNQIASKKADCQRDYYSQVEKLTDAKDIALVSAIQSLNPNDPCPTVATNNDVKIIRTQERHKTGRKALGMVPIVYGIQAGAEVAKDAVNKEPVIVDPPEPIIIEPTLVEPFIVE